MDIANIQGYAYVFAMGFLIVVLYAYIYHLYTKRKNADGTDYEEYSNMALHDDLSDTPVADRFDAKKK
ncbi:MAG: CcoQ/FixQ family Cbb3-type cytochrome c oxidase assembly chaperone [Sulfurimonas sp.]|jgi:cytochrome c oxidase cbb3-type subunit 4|nr:CcoQ/FixQ family Cbb3-type cytochrome c oxidase assembly chaperone [Sulfurimonas sp.]